jgi:hypothetical protein
MVPTPPIPPHDQKGRRLFALVRTLIDELGSQIDVARRAGLSPSYVSKIVRGEARADVVRSTTCESVLERLGLPADFFEAEPYDPKSWRRYQTPAGGPVVGSTPNYPSERDLRVHALTYLSSVGRANERKAGLALAEAVLDFTEAYDANVEDLVGSGESDV